MTTDTTNASKEDLDKAADLFAQGFEDKEQYHSDRRFTYWTVDDMTQQVRCINQISMDYDEAMKSVCSSGANDSGIPF